MWSAKSHEHQQWKSTRGIRMRHSDRIRRYELKTERVRTTRECANGPVAHVVTRRAQWKPEMCGSALHGNGSALVRLMCSRLPTTGERAEGRERRSDDHHTRDPCVGEALP